MTRSHEQVPQPFPARRFRAGMFGLLLAALCAAQSFAQAPIGSYPTLTLKDGRTFKAVEVVNYTASGILVRHSAGATTFRFEILPEAVIETLHLKGWEKETGFAALADKPAVADSTQPSDLSLADRPAVVESVDADLANRAAVASPASDLANLPAVAAPVAVIPPKSSAAPAGEGNFEEIVAPLAPPVAPAAPARLIGRVVITLPAGTFFVADAEVRAYPAQLLAGYLAEAKAKARQAAQNFRAQADAAAREGRLNDAGRLSAQAERAAARTLDYLPTPAATARSDEFGNFTLQPTLGDVHVVARGRLEVAQTRLNYEWVGVAGGEEIALTETNATSVAEESNAPRFATR